MLRRVKIDEVGNIRVNGQHTARIKRDKEVATVLVQVDGTWLKIAAFRNFKPNMSARSWAKFMLARRTPRQLIKTLQRHGPIEYARRLGFIPPTEREISGQMEKINRKSRTGSVKK